ncbi:hypothetical protein [Micromonospora sp. LOL_015]|uniref:hypothetical protein n=1 Tax=Micromonospora sp. LOL_015 TaxID=3345416 RepID=UPI003A845E65
MPGADQGKLFSASAPISEHGTSARFSPDTPSARFILAAGVAPPASVAAVAAITRAASTRLRVPRTDSDLR